MPRVKIHPLFLAVGVWYCFTGELFLFLMSCVIALQHECAHAFAAGRLGYKLNKIVLMPYGAVIDGDLRGISLKDEIYVAACGPLCNLCTAAFFAAWWWFTPTVYAFTDIACYSSLAIAIVNLLPAYPLDGGRILRCLLARGMINVGKNESKAERIAERICRAVTLIFALTFFVVFAYTATREPNFSALAFGTFLLFGSLGNGERATYARMDFSCRDGLKKGLEIKRVALLETCAIKDVLGYLSRGSYLIVEVYDENERRVFDLSQNELSDWFLRAKSPYDSLKTLKNREKVAKIE